MPVVSLVRKITSKSILGAEPSWDSPDQKQKTLYTVVGVAHHVERGESQFGAWKRFHGEFVAIPEGKNEQFRSGQVFFPPPFEDMLESQIANSENSVEFAVKVGIKRPTTQRTGGSPYEYEVTPIIEFKKNDTIAGLLTKIEDGMETDKTDGSKK